MNHDVFEGNKYKYVLTGVDLTSRYKVAQALETKKVAFVLQAKYKKVFEFK